ncbi:MAG: isopenicillin N synthase-like dioxygenase [Myxococcota bacterium]|jgi:isopenicillin N synthase-like dioxygenase
MNAAPVIDLPALRANDADAIRAVRTGLGDFGLVYVRGHGIDLERVGRLYDAYVDVLSRPTPEKATWGGSEIWFQRGWTPPNTEQAVVAGGRPDFKECFFASAIEPDPNCERWFPQLFARNVWPDGADAFRTDLMAVGRAVHGVGLELLRGCATALDLPPDTLVDLTRGAANVTRLLRYLPLTPDQARDGLLWGEEHTDFNLLTLLPGGAFFRDGARTSDRPTGCGLRLRTRPTDAHPLGEQVSGRPPPGCLVVQVGQQLEILTGGALVATPHVVTPPGEAGWSRCSLAHFVHVHPQRTLFPLDRFSASADAYAPPVLAGTYAVKTLVDIGLAPAEALNALGYRHYGRLATIREAELGLPG